MAPSPPPPNPPPTPPPGAPRPPSSGPPAPTGRLDPDLAARFAGWLAESGIQSLSLIIDSEPPQPLAARLTDLPAILLRASTATRAQLLTPLGHFEISQGRLRRAD